MREIRGYVEKERFILIGIIDTDEEATMTSLDELSRLLETAGGEECARMTQRLPHPDIKTYFGSGKVDELRLHIEAEEADGVLCDDELSPTQLHALSSLLGVKVIDRTILILDIFAAHATTKEGKIQVELAQLKYRASHLSGLGKELSRQGGGIGTRGPGETKLETDRRTIRHRIGQLGRQIREIESVRETGRKRRMRNRSVVIAIVGYTNAGKSTLLNALTGAEVLAEDKLFATLDPTTRALNLPDGMQVLLTDTVGFIHKLPHQLIEAFRSTLEEAGYADIILHVIDASDREQDMHRKVVYKTLSELGISGKPVITAFNKTDMAEDEIFRDPAASKTVLISAKEGKGLDQLIAVISDVLKERQTLLRMQIPYSESAFAGRVRQMGQVMEEEYREDGIFLRAYVPPDLAMEYQMHIALSHKKM
ncbi:MAG: GTPase HflX [Lachnospiraceae bacterium]|nr:GTPase HflX [Lachnospiraceae bacterium]